MSASRAVSAPDRSRVALAPRPVGGPVRRGVAALLSMASFLSRSGLSRSGGGFSGKGGEEGCHGVDGVASRGVPLREPRGIVIGEPRLTRRILPDQGFQRQIDA